MVSNPSIGCACNRGLQCRAHRSVTKWVPVDAQQEKKGTRRKQQNDRNVAPARIAFSLGLAFNRNRVVEGLGFSSDGSAGRLVGLQAEAGLPQGGQVLCGQTVAPRVGLSASGFSLFLVLLLSGTE